MCVVPFFRHAERNAVVLCLVVVVFTPMISVATEPQWQPALGYGGAPRCPEHSGSRTYRSDIVRDSHTTAFITGVSLHKTGGCQATAEIEIAQANRSRRFKLPNSDVQSFSIVDFSPDGSRLLLALENRNDEQYQRRDVSVALMPLTSGQLNWHNAWDLFGWKDCDAMVEPQGFLPDGRVVIRARKSVVYGDTHPNCVNEIGLYAVDLTTNTVVHLPDSTKVVRYGKRVRPGFQACKSDPDIVGACFRVHGRLSAWNGTPTMRIWRVGTKRILGVRDDIMPEALTSKMNWDVEAYGDFELCPFTQQRPEEMQMVCIEAAEHVVVKKR